jgi:hypothetical protein
MLPKGVMKFVAACGRGCGFRNKSVALDEAVNLLLE